MARTAQSLHESAVEYANRGRLTSAHRLLTLAAARASDVDLRARIEGTLALVRARMGSVAEGERLCAAAIDTPGTSAETSAILAGQMGSILEAAGHLARATSWLTRAIDTVGDDVARAHLLMNRATIAMQRRRLADAASDTERAVSAYQDHDRDVDAAEALHNLGYIAMLRGDLVEAMRRMSAARVVFASASPVSAAVGDVDRAEVLREAGLATESELILVRAARVFGQHRMPQARAETEVGLARSQLAHDPAGAVRTAKDAARRFRALGNATWAARADGIRVRAALVRRVRDRQGVFVRRAPAPAPHEVEAVVRALRGAGLPEDARAVQLALQLHGTDSGRIVRTGAATPIDVKLLAREVRVVRAGAAGREFDVRRHAAAGLDELGRWQASFGSLDLQTAAALHGTSLLQAGLASAMRSRRPEVAFEWSERARQASQRSIPLRPPPDETAAAELAELRLLRAQSPDGDWLASPRVAELHDRARDRQWAGTGAAGLEPRIDLADLVASLGPGIAVASYLFTGDELSCVIATDHGASLVDVPAWPSARSALAGLRADLDMAASVRSCPLAGAVHASLAARLAVLSDALLAPVIARFGDQALVLTAPGVLSGLPWSMLPAMRSRVFTLAISATRWASTRGVSTAPVQRVGFAAGPRVPRAVEEVSAAASHWTRTVPTATLQGDDADVRGVEELAGGVDLLHIAAHGRHAADNPLFSGLELHDGTLFGYDIDRMPRVPPTVVLSACEVGRSSVRGGEEAIGMTRVWLHAGARCVIAAPVAVDDDDACEVLAATHERLAAGAPPSVALAAATEQTGRITPFQVYGSGF